MKNPSWTNPKAKNQAKTQAKTQAGLVNLYLIVIMMLVASFFLLSHQLSSQAAHSASHWNRPQRLCHRAYHYIKKNPNMIISPCTSSSPCVFHLKDSQLVLFTLYSKAFNCQQLVGAPGKRLPPAKRFQIGTIHHRLSMTATDSLTRSSCHLNLTLIQPKVAQCQAQPTQIQQRVLGYFSD